MKILIYVILLIFQCSYISAYDLSTWKAWQPVLSKYLGKKYENFYRMGGSFPGPMDLQRMITQDVENLTRKNPIKGLEFYEEADRIMRKTGSPMFDPQMIKKNITRKVMKQAYKSFDSVPSIARRQANQILKKYPDHPEAQKMKDAVLEKEIKRIREQMTKDMEGFADLSPKELKAKVNKMCAMARKFPSEGDFMEMCKGFKAESFQGKSDQAEKFKFGGVTSSGYTGYQGKLEQNIMGQVNSMVQQQVEEQVSQQKSEWLESMTSKMSALEGLDASKSLELGKEIQRKFAGDSNIQEMVKQVSERVETNLESTMNSYSEVDVKKLKPEELLSLNKDSCQLMELRPSDQLSMELCIESNREVRLRKRKDFRAWAKIVQKFQQKRENELRKRLRSYE